MRERDELFIPYGRRDGQRGGARADMRIVIFFSVALVVLGLAGWLYLRQASEVTHLASLVRQREMQKEALHRELVILNAQVAVLGSLKRVLQEGTEMGYVLPQAGDPAHSLILSCNDCLPTGASTPVPPEGSSGASAAKARGPWQMLTDWLSGWLRPWAVQRP